MFEDNGNKCGKCQNHDFEVLKKGHARDCPFKKCNCLKCRLLDARSDILQVISGKETKLKGTKKDPNCGFCQNHGVKILRKGHVRSCSFGQERHFRLDNCFDCEVHYIRNEVNRLQIKMRRAMKEDRTLSEEQRKTAREAITRDEVEKVCDMARLARKKRESILAQQVGEPSAQASSSGPQHSPPSSSAPMAVKRPKVEHELARQTGGVWRPWSQHQVAAAMARHQPQPHQLHQPGPLNGLLIAPEMHQVAPPPPPPPPQPSLPPQPQAPNNFFMSSLQVAHQQHQLLERQQQHRNLILEEQLGVADDISNGGQQSPPPTPPEQPLALIRPNLHEQQLFNTLFRLIVAQFGQPTPTNL